MNKKRLNIAVKPNKDITNYSIEVSKKLSNTSDTHFVLDGVNYFPHITVYSPEFPEKNIEDIITRVKDVAKETKLFTVDFSEFDIEDGYIGINLNKTRKLKNLHNKILNLLNPLRESVLRDKYKDEAYLAGLPTNKRNNILEFGYPNVMEQWVPHLTLIRYVDESIAEVEANKLKWEIESFPIESLGIFEMGKNGTCTKIVEEFTLSV